MKNIELIIPKVDEYSYKKKLENDEKTMNYNAGYDVEYEAYHYNTGCIDFNKDKWISQIKDDNNYFAYVKDCDINTLVGYVNYYYNKINNIYECSILIEYKYRSKGYGKDALKLLVKTAYENGIDYLYDNFEESRENALKVFLDVGFDIYKKTSWKKFNEEVDGVIVRIKTNKVLPDYSNLKIIDDVLNFMKDNIRYGWLDINNNIHIGNMKDFRRLYKTLSIDEILKYGIGTCIDQVNLMNYLLNKINIKNKMFATRIYEDNNFNEIDAEEHMHCFILAFIDNMVYHIEHPNFYKIGIYKYSNELEALNTINEYYINLSGGISRPITEFYEVEENISFKEFNNYINNLDINDNYYKAYEKRYQQVYKYNYLWSSKEPTSDVLKTIISNKIPLSARILEIGCGEGRDAIFLLNNNYNILALDYSHTVIEKCKELSNYKYNDSFRQFDIINDELDEKFIFIYSIAVIHMFVNKEHRNKFYNFIYNHLEDNGSALIMTMGNGIDEYKTDINTSFDDVKRTIINSNKKINVATTSCNIVNWKTFEEEILNNNLIIKRKWISNDVPEFNPMMCVIISKR